MVFGHIWEISDWERDESDRSGFGLRPRVPRWLLVHGTMALSQPERALPESQRQRPRLPPRPQFSSVNASDPNLTARFRIYQSREVQRRWKMAPARLPEVLSNHWLQTWRVDFLKRAGSPVFLVTNEETLYTWVFPKPEVPNRQAFERLFRVRLDSALADYPNRDPWVSAPIDYVSGNPRRLIGVMNNMADHLVWRGSGPTDDEEVVNTMPFQGQLEGRPERAFWGRLRLDRESETARTTPIIDSSL